VRIRPAADPDPPPVPLALPKLPCVLPHGHDGKHNHWTFVA